MDETIAIQQLQNADTAEAALAEILREYSSYVCAIIARTLNNSRDTFLIEELASDVFFALWTHRNRLKTQHLRGFLATVSKNRGISYLRSAAAKSQPEELGEDLWDGRDLLFLLEEKEKAEVLERGLSQIPEAYRQTLMLYYYDGKNTSEIAEILGASRENVKRRLQRGREKLKKILEQVGYHELSF